MDIKVKIMILIEQEEGEAAVFVVDEEEVVVDQEVVGMRVIAVVLVVEVLHRCKKHQFMIYVLFMYEMVVVNLMKIVNEVMPL